MLSMNVLERHFQAQRFDRIVDNVAENGLALPLPLRIRLSQSPVASVGLGLRRLVELTYLPTPLCGRMTEFLIAAQRPDGAFGEASEQPDIQTADPLATAIAAAGLAKVIDEYPSSQDTLRVRSAFELAIAALAAMQNDDGLFAGAEDRSDDDKALVSAFILLLLGQNEHFRSSIRMADLLNWFEFRQGRLNPTTAQIWRMARSIAIGEDVSHAVRRHKPAFAA